MATGLNQGPRSLDPRLRGGDGEEAGKQLFDPCLRGGDREEAGKQLFDPCLRGGDGEEAEKARIPFHVVTPAKAGVHQVPKICHDGGIVRPCVYILASQRHGTLYIGVTSNLGRRVWQHKCDVIDGFTKRYHVHRLVYFEFHATMADAILREKRVKKWRRAWKVSLIENANPAWRDRYEEIGR